MKKLNEVYVATDGASLFDTDGHIYSLTSDTINVVGFTEEKAKEVCSELNRYAYPGMIKVAKVEIFAKVTF